MNKSAPQPAMSGGVPSDEHRQPVGLIAAWGRYPVVVAEALRRQGRPVVCAAVRGHADPVLKELCDHHYWIGPAKLGTTIRHFRRHGVTQATMAGKFHKVEIFKPWIWMRFLPDATFLRAFYPHFISGTADRKDDTLLGVIVRAFQNHGVELVPATDFAEELLVECGVVAGKPLSRSQQADVDFGWTIAKEMGRLDIGQSVCVKDRAVIAVEAIEGTDECIRRAGQYCPKGGFTIVKVAKPQQDMRFDVPTIGLLTLQTMVDSGAQTLVVEGDRTILLDMAKFQKFAHRNGLTIVASSLELERQSVA